MVRDLWGDGSDGAFSFPTPSSGGSCVAVTDCPSICSTCTDRNGSDETEGCICSLPLNANIGTEYTSETATSSIVNFTTFTMGDKNELTINRSQPSAECGSDNGSNLIIRVQGDFTMDDGASGTRNDARINMEGLGECGDWNHSDVDNRAGFAGCGTHAGTGGAAGAIGRNDGSAGEEIAWTWRVGDPWMLNLFGRSGGAPTDNQTSECSASISDYLGPLLGGAGGGGPGCAGTLGSACTGGNKINGNGGGGLAIFVGGTLTAGQYA